MHFDKGDTRLRTQRNTAMLNQNSGQDDLRMPSITPTQTHAPPPFNQSRRFKMRHTSLPHTKRKRNQSPFRGVSNEARKVGPILNMNAPLNTLNRVSLYQSKIQLDDYEQLMSLNLQKDNLKMYFVLFDEETKLRNELSMFLKQATQVLMYCQNDFRRFVGELLVVKHGKVTFRDINQVVEKLAIENIRKA